MLSCARTEEAKYRALKSSLKYKAYQTASKLTVKEMARASRTQLADTAALSPESLHLLLGLVWAAARIPDLVIAEGDLVREDSQARDFGLCSTGLVSIGMVEKGWDDLAQKEALAAEQDWLSRPRAGSSPMDIAVFHLLMGSACLYLENYRAAGFHYHLFVGASGIEWPYGLLDAVQDIEDGRLQQGLVKLKQLAERPEVPEELRVTIRQRIAAMEQDTGPVESKLFWPRAILAAVIHELKTKTATRLGSVVAKVVAEADGLKKIR